MPRASTPPAAEKATVKAPVAPMAIAVLKADHTNAVELFDAFVAAKAEGNPLTRRALAIQIATELTVHATIEEEIFYPAAEDALGNEASLVEDAIQEHAEVKAMLAQLMDAVETLPVPAKIDTIVKKITAAVLQHIEEEENELFPAVERSGLDLAATGLALSLRKQELKRLISKEGQALVASMVREAAEA